MDELRDHATRALRRVLPVQVQGALNRWRVRQTSWDHARWAIGVLTGDHPLTLHATAAVTNPIVTRDDVTDREAGFVADPFAITVDGTWHLFFEVLDTRDGKGVVAVATSSNLARWSYEGVVLTERYHLSYPQVFTDRGRYYMIPETWQAGAVLLYEAVDFPARWQVHARLLDGEPLVDPSPFRADGRWYLLAASDRARDFATLRLYTAAALSGPWSEHPASPVIVDDPAVARPAGRVVALDDGRWLRLAQSGGTALRAFAIESVGAAHYHEAPLKSPKFRFDHSWAPSTLHHLDAHRLDDGRWVGFVDGF